MKKIPVLLLLMAVLVPAALSAASFEGKVTMKMTGPKGSPSQMNFSVKEGFTRIDIVTQGASPSVIMDQGKQQLTILMTEQKMYMIQPMPKPPETPAAGGAPDHVAGGSGPDVQVTTVTENILGYDCTKLVATDKEKNTTTEIWVTDQLGTFMGMGPGANPMGGRRGGAAAQAWAEALRGKGSFPLRVITTKDGKETFRMEATSIEKQSLDASLFEAPADYRDIGSMMKGLMPGGMPPGARPPGSG
jgi:hypothetical protein